MVVETGPNALCIVARRCISGGRAATVLGVFIFGVQGEKPSVELLTWTQMGTRGDEKFLLVRQLKIWVGGGFFSDGRGRGGWRGERIDHSPQW